MGGLTLDLAGHLGPKGVRVNTIAPGGFAGDCVSPNGGINGEQQAGEGREGPPPGFIKDFSGGASPARRCKQNIRCMYRTRALSVTLVVRAGVPLGHMGRDGVDLGAHAPLGFSHWVACLSRLLRRRRGAVPRGAGVRLRDGRHATGRRRVLDLALKRRLGGRLRGSVCRMFASCS